MTDMTRYIAVAEVLITDSRNAATSKAYMNIRDVLQEAIAEDRSIREARVQIRALKTDAIISYHNATTDYGKHAAIARIDTYTSFLTFMMIED